jgi:hypothetical protein
MFAAKPTSTMERWHCQTTPQRLISGRAQYAAVTECARTGMRSYEYNGVNGWSAAAIVPTLIKAV